MHFQCTGCQKWVHKKCSGIKGSMYKVMKSFICTGCSNPVISTAQTSVDIGASANLEVVVKFCYLGDMLSVDEMRMQRRRPESELDGINSGSWYHCLPIGIYHWLGEGGCIAVVYKVVCYTEVRPGLSGKKMRWHFSKQRWEWSDVCVMLRWKTEFEVRSWEKD